MKLIKFTYLIIFISLISCNEKMQKQEIKNYLLDVNKNNYDKIVKKRDKLIVIGYFRDKDKMNNNFKDILNKTAKTLNDSITFAHIDVDKNYQFAREKNIRCVPTYKFIKNGKILRSFNGTMDSLQLDCVISDINSDLVKVESENLYAND